MNFGASPRSKPVASDVTSPASGLHERRLPFTLELALAVAALAALVCIAGYFFYQRGNILWWGDAAAHLNISRRILDSQTPGYEQLGSPWLPALHVICLPFVLNDQLWTTGLAGTIPVAICFVIGGAFFYLAARETWGSRAAAAIALASLALNPNLLYLSSIPMAETVFFAELAAVLYAVVAFRRKQTLWLVALAGVAILLATLTRYDGWFLIPFTALALMLPWNTKRSSIVLLLFLAIVSIGPICWIAYNRYEFGDALWFYTGPYSAKAIYQRALDAGLERYRGDHQWGYAFEYYFAAGLLCTGWLVSATGALGAAASIWRYRRALLPIGFLLLVPLFYVWGVYSSGQTMFVPHLWPFSYYNTRYGIAVLPVAAFAVGGLVIAIPPRWRLTAVAIPLASAFAWLIPFSPDRWVCWKESQVNSVTRRAWTHSAAGFFRANYHPGDMVLAPFGDLTGILCEASLPLKDSIHEGNGDEWLATLGRLDLYHRPKWAIAQEGDELSKAIDLASWKREIYQPVLEIHSKDAPVLMIYRLTNDSSVFHPAAPARKVDTENPDPAVNKAVEIEERG
jgi:4-amino-4-deoxy-L-arabinose transferase-like glycosyltransferase